MDIPDDPHPIRRWGLAKRAVDVFDWIAIPLVWYSVITLAIECHLYPETGSRQNPAFFIWSERVVAWIFTVEYLVRCLRNSGRGFYPITPFGLIDLIAILPFWLGFIPALQPHLRLVRTIRALRMLKFFRYSRGMQLMALGFYRAYFNLKPLLMTTAIVILFTMFALYEVEGDDQETFRDLFTVGWFLEVTGTTVGYGDLSPQSTAGKVIVMIYMVAGLAIFMACFSAITSAFDRVFEEAADPDFDPLEQFPKVRKYQERIEELNRDVGTTDAEDAAAIEEAVEQDPEDEP